MRATRAGGPNQGETPMKKLPMLAGAIAAVATTALAADNPVAVRQALMDNNGSAAAVAGGIMKDEIAYSPVVGKAVIMSLNATAHAVGDFFPEGSAGPAGDSNAAPKIWEDAAGFQSALTKFGTDVAAAVQASGKDGPPDKAAFVAAVQPVLGNCKTCHETYRIKN
jgi:cytochrome c556